MHTESLSFSYQENIEKQYSDNITEIASITAYQIVEKFYQDSTAYQI